MSLADATTVDLSDWAARFRRRTAAQSRPPGHRRVLRPLLGLAWFVFDAASTVLFLAAAAGVAFVVILAAREAAVALLGWRWR